MYKPFSRKACKLTVTETYLWIKLGVGRGRKGSISRTVGWSKALIGHNRKVIILGDSNTGADRITIQDFFSVKKEENSGIRECVEVFRGKWMDGLVNDNKYK